MFDSKIHWTLCAFQFIVIIFAVCTGWTKKLQRISWIIIFFIHSAKKQPTAIKQWSMTSSGDFIRECQDLFLCYRNSEVLRRIVLFTRIEWLMTVNYSEWQRNSFVSLSYNLSLSVCFSFFIVVKLMYIILFPLFFRICDTRHTHCPS